MGQGKALTERSRNVKGRRKVGEAIFGLGGRGGGWWVGCEWEKVRRCGDCGAGFAARMVVGDGTVVVRGVGAVKIGVRFGTVGEFRSRRDGSCSN